MSVLEEWDELIGENWEKNDQKYLNPVVWIREHPKYRTFKTFITSSISNSYNIIDKLVEDHNKIISLFLNFKTSDLSKLANPCVQDQSTIFELIFENLKKCSEYLNTFLLDKADISIYSV